MKILKKMGYRCAKAGGAGEDVACYMKDVEKTRADMKSSDVTVRAKARTKQRKALQLASKLPDIGKIIKTGVQLGKSAITGALNITGVGQPIAYAIEGIVEGGFYDNARRKGYSHEQAMAETFTAGLLAGRPEGVPWYGGAEALIKKELIGDVQQNPKVKQYTEALKDQERVYDAFAEKNRGLQASRPDIADPASADIQDLYRSGTISNINRIMNPESMASQAYNTAVEKQDALQQKRRTEYLEQYDPRALEHEQKSFDIYVRDREGNILYEKPTSLYKKRYKEMDEKFPSYGPETIKSMFKTANVDIPENFNYDLMSNLMKNEDKMNYFADNFRTEKSEGGITGLRSKYEYKK